MLLDSYIAECRECIESNKDMLKICFKICFKICVLPRKYLSQSNTKLETFNSPSAAIGLHCRAICTTHIYIQIYVYKHFMYHTHFKYILWRHIYIMYPTQWYHVIFFSYIYFVELHVAHNMHHTYPLCVYVHNVYYTYFNSPVYIWYPLCFIYSSLENIVCT